MYGKPGTITYFTLNPLANGGMPARTGEISFNVKALGQTKYSSHLKASLFVKSQVKVRLVRKATIPGYSAKIRY